MEGLAAALRGRYARGEQDTWMKPLVAVDGGGKPLCRIGPGEAAIFCCRRGDREVQLARAFVDREFPHFARIPLPGLELAPLVEYHERLAAEPLLDPIRPEATLAEVLSRAGLKQLAVTESEKQAHVTFFFNGRRSEPFSGQDTAIIPSLRDPDPAMRSREIGETAAAGLGDHDFVLVNFPAGDVVGHTRDFEAKVAAVRAVDDALGILVRRAGELGATVLVTADHGLVESGRAAGGGEGFPHTRSPVPFVVVDRRLRPADILRRQGSLADAAPTVLGLLGLPQPALMTGAPLLDQAVRSSRVVLVVLDGWGLGEDDPRSNPIAAGAPTLRSLLARFPHAALEASGPAVGLPEGRGGNSEAGHLAIGAGRVVEQDELRLRRAFADGFAGHPRLAALLRGAAARGATLHLIGLLSEASSHGTISEPIALARIARRESVDRLCLHLILDRSRGGAAELLDKYAQDLRQLPVVTAVGRGYALDRSGDYSRTEVAYRALVEGAGDPYRATVQKEGEWTSG